MGIGHRAFSKSLLSKLLTIFLFANFFSVKICKAQIPATTPDKIQAIIGYDHFLIPTVTDGFVDVSSGVEKYFQVIGSSTPYAQLLWDDGNGHVGTLLINSAGIGTLLTNANILIDDIALNIDNNGNINCYLTCRALLGASYQIHLIQIKWVTSNFSFQPSNNPSLLETVNLSNELFNRVRLDINNEYNTLTAQKSIAIVWSVNNEVRYRLGNILVNTGLINYTSTSQSIMNGTILDVSLTEIDNIGFGLAIAAKNGNAVYFITRDDSGVFDSPQLATQSSGIGDIRMLSLDYKYGTVFLVNDNVNNVNKKTKLEATLAKKQLNVYTKWYLDLNQEFESTCSNNTNYKYTGFPSASLNAIFPFSKASVYDVSWQQIRCNNQDFCTINAVTKRVSQYFSETPIIANNNQAIYLSSDQSKNTLFPAVNNYKHRMFYSFGIMDKVNSNNGKIGYKNTKIVNFGGTANPIDPEILKVNPKYEYEEDVNKTDIMYSKEKNIVPNPASNSFTISFSSKIRSVIIIDLLGKKVYQNEGITSNNETINSSNFKNGTYILIITDNKNKTTTQKIFINH